MARAIILYRTCVRVKSSCARGQHLPVDFEDSPRLHLDRKPRECQMDGTVIVAGRQCVGQCRRDRVVPPDADAIAAASGGTTRPAPASTSREASLSAATTGSPAASASASTSPWVSVVEGKMNASADA